MLIYFIISFLVAIMMHEIIHAFFAYVFGLKPKFKISKFGNPCIEYSNTKEYLKIFITAISAPVIMIIFSYIIPMNNIFLLIKVILMLNVFNLLPITTDGEVAIYALLNLWKSQYGKQK